MKKIFAILLALSIVFCLCACGNNATNTDTDNKIQNGQTQTSSKEETTAKFEVIVLSEGVGVKGVMVQLCKDACVPAMTNENGVATFNVEITDGYKLSIMSCPDGYEYTGDAEIYLHEGETQYSLEIFKE